MPKSKDPNTWFQNALKVTEDAGASSWLKNALLEAINSDPFDSARDAEVLYIILKLRSGAVQRPALASTTSNSPKTPAAPRIES
jgi:hypothetical protein